jgi:hypothetical protein
VTPYPSQKGRQGRAEFEDTRLAARVGEHGPAIPSGNHQGEAAREAPATAMAEAVLAAIRARSASLQSAPFCRPALGLTAAHRRELFEPPDTATRQN